MKSATEQNVPARQYPSLIKSLFATPESSWFELKPTKKKPNRIYTDFGIECPLRGLKKSFSSV